MTTRIDPRDVTALRSFFNQVLAGEKNDPTGSASGPYGHGPGGLFSQAGQDPVVFSAFPLPLQGALGNLPVYNDADDTESGPSYGGTAQDFITTITGVTKGAAETFANQPTTDCADGARAGLMKNGTIVVTYGRFRFAPSAAVSIVKAGMRRDIADPMTLRLMNQPNAASPFLPAQIQNGGMAIMNEFARRNYEIAVSSLRFLSQMAYVGSPANNSGEAKQFMGLDLWINQNNKRDAQTSGLITALNSELFDFGYSLVSANTRDIQAYAEHTVAALDYKVIREGLGATWDGEIYMRPEAWDEISKVIAVRQYQEALNQSNLFTNGRLMVNGADALEFRNRIRSQMVWPLRGRDIPVVLDDGIAEVTPNQTASLAAGQFASDIYFVPRTVLGGYPVTYWKYYNHANDNSEALAQLPGSSTFTSDGGLFRWYINAKNGCIDWTIDMLPKLVMRTPQIAARIQKVAYQPLSHFIDVNPDSSYFANGGKTTGATQSFYTMWATTPQTIS